MRLIHLTLSPEPSHKAEACTLSAPVRWPALGLLESGLSEFDSVGIFPVFLNSPVFHFCNFELQSSFVKIPNLLPIIAAFKSKAVCFYHGFFCCFARSPVSQFFRAFCLSNVLTRSKICGS